MKRKTIILKQKLKLYKASLFSLKEILQVEYYGSYNNSSIRIQKKIPDIFAMDVAHWYNVFALLVQLQDIR